MTHTGLATVLEFTTDYSSREGAAITHVEVHHGATTDLPTMIDLQRPGGREVSSTLIIKDGTIVASVPEEYRPWTAGSGFDDRRSLTMEIANETLAPFWTVSEATFHSVAQVLADWSHRYGIPLDDDHILTHQELWIRFGRSYPTACPGDLQNRKGELLALAQAYANGTPAPTPETPAPTQPETYPATQRYGEHWVRLLQEDLNQMGHDLQVDGLDGEKTQAVVEFEQRKCAENGFGAITIDRIGGPDVRRYVDRWLAHTGKVPVFPLPRGWYFGPEDGPVESVSGYHGNDLHVARYQQRMQDRGWDIDVDGLYADQSGNVTGAFQTEKGLVVDRLAGIDTWTAAWLSPVT